MRTSRVTSLCAHGIGLRALHSHAHGISSLGYDYRTHSISPRSWYSRTQAVPILTPRQKIKFLHWIFEFMSLSFSRCTALFFLLRVSPTGFTAEVLMRPLGLYVFHFSSFMAFLCRSVLLACLLPPSAAREEVLQYLTRSALSRVESRHIRVFRLFTFPAFLSKIRQYTQDFIVPSNSHHNLNRSRTAFAPISASFMLYTHIYIHLP